jgi:AraC family transcriptional regulator
MLSQYRPVDGALTAPPPPRVTPEWPAGPEAERGWRRPGELDGARVLATRWTDGRSGARRERAVTPGGHYVIAVALKSAQLRLRRNELCLFEGAMAAGTTHVSSPGERLEAEFSSPCDFIHLYVSADHVQARHAPAAITDLFLRDTLAAELARSLLVPEGAADPLYTETVGNMILLRLLSVRTPPARVCALPKWRLRRVLAFIEANIAGPISLGDLAAVAGLSRMHFAAQFKAATGCRPHEHVLQQRIEAAQAMMSSSAAPLVEVALSVGFQTQSHFSTVFKRVVGQTPARWRRLRDLYRTAS